MDPYDHDLERGLGNRRAILGDAWVDKSAGGANSFNADFQNFISRYAWHEVWGRPGLDKKTRRIIVLAITCALGRWEEFELHLRAALAGPPETGLTPDDVKEVLMQCAIYAGVPAANTAVATAVKILRELGHELAPKSAADVSHTGTGRSLRSAGTPALHYTLREPRSGLAPRRTYVFSHALGADQSMWDPIANSLAADSRVICVDHRGHGDSDSPPGPYSLAEMAGDAERLLAGLDCGPVVWVGLSLGGMVGQELALRHPQRLQALVIANSTSGYPADGLGLWQQRIDAVEAGGVEAVADGAMQRWFSAKFRAEQPAVVARWRRRLVSTPAAGYLGSTYAVMNVDTTARLAGLRVPTLVIAGEFDEGTPVAMSRTIAETVPGATLVVLEGAAHLSAIERPQAFEAALRKFIEDKFTANAID